MLDWLIWGGLMITMAFVGVWFFAFLGIIWVFYQVHNFSKQKGNQNGNVRKL